MKVERDELDIESLLELLFVGDFEVVWPLIAQKIEPILPKMNISQDKAGEIAKHIVLKTRANPLCRQVKPTRRGGFDQLKVVFGQILRESIRGYSPKWEGHKEPDRELSLAEVLERDEKLRDVPTFSQLPKLEEEEEEGGDFTEEEIVSTLLPDDDYEGDYDDIDDKRSEEDILRDGHKHRIDWLSVHIERLHSDKERDIMNSFLCGKRGKEIADSLSVSPSYVSKVIRKHLKRFGYSESQVKELKLDIKEYT